MFLRESNRSTALKTLSLRLRGATVELEEAGLETDNMAESTSKLQKKLLALTGVDIMLDENTFKDPTQILREIASAWQDIEDIDRAAALELMGGKQQANVLASILNNFEIVEDAIVSSSESSNSALEENARWMNSIEGKVQQFNNAVQTMWMNFISSDIVKFFVDLGTAAIELIDKFGLLITVGGALTSIFAIKNSSSILMFFKELTVGVSQAEKMANAAAKLRNVIGAGKASVDAYAAAIKGLNADEATQILESQGLTAAEIKETLAVNANTSAKKLNKAATIGLTAGLAAAAIALTVGISLWNKYKQEQEDARQAAVDASNAYKENVKSINSYKSKIAELKESLDSGTLSEEEAYQARLDLISLKDDMVSTLGAEAKSIDILKDSADECNAALDGLTVSIAKTNLAENSEQIEVAIEKMEEVKDWFATAGAIGWSDEIDADTLKELQNIVSKYDGASLYSNGTNGNGGEWLQLAVRGNAEEAKETLVGIINDIEKLAKEKGVSAEDLLPNNRDWAKTFQTMIGKTNDVIDKYKEIYDQQIVWKIVADVETNTVMNQISNAQKEIKEAIASGSDEKLSDALANFDNVKASLKTIIDDDTVDQSVKDYLSNLVTDIETSSKSYVAELNFKTDFNSSEKDIKQSIEKILEKIGTNDIYGIKSVGVESQSTVNTADEYYANGNSAEADEMLSNMSEQEKAYQDLCYVAKQYDMEVDDLMPLLVEFGLVHDSSVKTQAKIAITTIDTLTASIEGYQSALETVNNIAHDGQAISEDYYKTLKENLDDVTVAEQDLSDAIEQQNGKYIVKNVTLLNKLVAQSKKAQQATINVAKAQARTQYKSLTQQIQNVVKSMANEYKAQGFVNKATLDNVDAMQNQMSALKQTIHQYTLLELELSDATNGYREFEKAQERDAKLSYGDSMIEMIQSINDGFVSGKVGTEAFQAAVQALVPDSVYKDLDNMEARMKAIHDYLDKDSLFADYFTVDEDGNMSVSFKNIKSFVDDMQSLGIFTGENASGFSLASDAGDIDDIVAKFATVEGSAGLTKEAFVAMVTEMSKYDARWSNILEEIMATPLDREIIRATDEVDVAQKALEDFWKAGEWDATKYQELCSNLDTATQKLNSAEQAAANNARQYNLCQTAIAAYNGSIKVTQEEANSLATALGLVNENGQPSVTVNSDGTLALTDDQINTILTKLGLLEEPTTLHIQTDYENIKKQIDEIKAYLAGGIQEASDSEILYELGIGNYDEAKAKLDELTAEKKNIEVTYGITDTSDEQQKSVLESYKELAKNGLEFSVTADVTDADQKIKELNENNPEDKQVILTADGSNASEVIYGIAQQIEGLKDKNVTITVTEKKSFIETVKGLFGSSQALGNAFASGNTGLKSNEHNAIVGECGPELVNLWRDNLFNCWNTLKLIKLQR